MSAHCISSCQVCHGKNLVQVFDFGYLPPVNDLYSSSSAVHPNQVMYRLNLVQCNDCLLVQLDTIVNKEIIFPKSYPYRSGSTDLLKRNFQDLSDEIKKLAGISESDLVVDIGSNDGTLLEPIKLKNFKVLGIEPTNAAIDANKRGIETIQAYFDDKVISEIISLHGKPKVITAANVFAHIENPNKVLHGINQLLDKNGYFISENHYLGSVVEGNQYDTVYHEHLRYYSLHSLVNYLNKFDFKIFKVQKIPSHGGSIRVFACRQPIESDDSVNMLLEDEKKNQYDSDLWIKGFQNSVLSSKFGLYSMLQNLQEKFNYNKILAVGAPSRGSTYLNFIGLDQNIIQAVLEYKNSPKVGNRIPGSNVEIVSEDSYEGEKDVPLLFLSWHIMDELLPKLRKKGFTGPAIKPLAVPQIIL